MAHSNLPKLANYILANDYGMNKPFSQVSKIVRFLFSDL